MKNAILKNYLRVSDINVATFSMKVNDSPPWRYDIPYEIKLSGMTIKSYLSDYSANLDLLRHQLERYTFEGKTEIDLYYEDSPTIIRIKRISALDRTEDIGQGIVFHWKEFDLVEIIPNSFLDSPSVSGYCEPNQVVNEIYETLLYIGRYGYEYDMLSHDNPWGCSPSVFYNSIKSPIIENFISKLPRNEEKLQLRQTIIKHAYMISPDYDAQFDDKDNSGLSYEKDDEIEFYDDSGKLVCKMVVDGFEEWFIIFLNNADFANSCMSDDFDRVAWHERGIELACKIRNQLPIEYDLWYGFPFEDEKNRDKRPILIF